MAENTLLVAPLTGEFLMLLPMQDTEAIGEKIAAHLQNSEFYELACGLGNAPHRSVADVLTWVDQGALAFWEIFLYHEGVVRNDFLVICSLCTTLMRFYVYATTQNQLPARMYDDVVGILSRHLMNTTQIDVLFAHLPLPIDQTKRYNLLWRGFEEYGTVFLRRPPPRQVFGLNRTIFVHNEKMFAIEQAGLGDLLIE